MKNSKEVQTYLGEGYKRTDIVSGSIETSGQSGSASINYKLKGQNGISTAYVVAEKVNDVWVYKEVLLFKIKGSTEAIDLLK